MVVNGNSHLINRSFSIVICGKHLRKWQLTQNQVIFRKVTPQLSENGKTHQKRKEIECHLTRYHAHPRLCQIFDFYLCLIVVEQLLLLL